MRLSPTSGLRRRSGCRAGRSARDRRRVYTETETATQAFPVLSTDRQWALQRCQRRRVLLLLLLLVRQHHQAGQSRPLQRQVGVGVERRQESVDRFVAHRPEPDSDRSS